MPNNKSYPKPSNRKMPMEKIAARMSRSDSLSSYAEFGKIVPKEAQPGLRKKKKGGFRNPFEVIADALGGKK